MTHTTTEIAAMIERLEHMSKNTRDEYLHELAGRSAAMLRDVAAERDALAVAEQNAFNQRNMALDELKLAEAERDALAERVNRIAYKDHDLSAGLSWSGYIICGDSKSISAVKAAIHYGSQIDSYRTQFAERTKELEAERDRLAAMVEKLREALADIAALNDLSEAPEDEIEAYARGNLHECELLARAAIQESENG